MTEEIRSESLMNFKDRFREFLPVVVDVETAGLEPETDAILEVSMMTLKIDEKGRFVPDEQFSANIRPFPGSQIKKANIDFLNIDPFDESRNLVSEEEVFLSRPVLLLELNLTRTRLMVQLMILRKKQNYSVIY